MDWHEEIRRLDTALSRGEITAAEHRKRRDEVLAEASGGASGPRLLHRPGQVAAPEAPEHTVVIDAAQAAGNPQPELHHPPRSDRSWSGPIDGADVFSVQSKSGTGRGVLTSMVVLLGLAIVGAGLWWFLLGNDRASSAPPPASAPPTSAAPWGTDRLPNPTDALFSTTAVLTPQQALDNGFVRADDVESMKAAGVEKVYFRAVTENGLVYHLFAFQTAGKTGGGDLAANLLQGAKADVDGLPDGVNAARAEAPGALVLEATYGTDQGAVRIVVARQGEIDEPLMTTELRDAVRVTVGSLGVR
ncbi:hypothetical protein SAMN05192558_11931 [Actinokineospora alba]|uniref:Uncharacterized protein n=1 Tax=Actinokineospora alba TaxID=504798 RepID=A0A1H0WAY8_9PSEU|nr:SHOCT domain-containing protein [Actinokineospora alba]TDP66195.1 hypothetical protein C8E96_1694 [Actinokineospora alba]SDJ42600.1 hypothetical protein SAMN05421871_11575 [Actinokineospora alba]SDP87486.1 hypothetical protein SAMN05192558_11931 [Actinokineospora alba]